MVTSFKENQHDDHVLYSYLLDSISKRGIVSHAYIFEYDDYDSAYNFVKKFAKFLLCPSLDDNNTVGYLIDNNQYKDYYEIKTDNQYIKKEEVLNLQSEFKTKPINKHKVYVITDASKLNKSSANTLLKFLEEPEDGIVAVLLCKNKYQLIETIRSRCQAFSLKFNVNNLEYKDIALNFLQDLINNKYMFIVNSQSNKYSFLDDKNELILVCETILMIISEYLGCNEPVSVEEKILSKIEKGDIIKLALVIYDYITILKYNVNLKLANDKFILDLIGVITCTK